MHTHSVPLHHLPARTLSAAANMAVDTLLLEQYPQPDAPRFRHYGWANPAFTFGRTQRYEDARRALPVHVSWQDAHERFAKAFELVRRPTGGGSVDHRMDWTYALVIPASHPLFRAAATAVYRDCHRVLACALAQQGVAADLAPCERECAPTDAEARSDATKDSETRSDAAKDAGARCDATKDAEVRCDAAKKLNESDSAAAGGGSGVRFDATKDSGARCDAAARLDGMGACFTRAEPYDVVGEGGIKLAGAAQRRSREGLLVQGSVSRPEVGGINWQRFERDVVEGFARWLAATDGLDLAPPQPASVLVQEVPLPKWSAGQLQARIAHFAAPQWNRRR